MRKILILLLFLPLFIRGQNTFKAVVKDYDTKENLFGVNVFIKSLNLGGSSDTNGVVVIANIPKGSYEIVFSYVGYEKKEVEFEFPLSQKLPIEILLKNEQKELSSIVVTSTRTNNRIEDIPVRVEVIGEEEVNEEGSMKPANISMLLSENPGVQAQQTSSVNGNVSIRLLGLDGKYTQILKDGFPLYSGFAQGLSVTQIPPLDLKQVEIIKGSSSSLYGSDAIAGIINLISKEPEEKRQLAFIFNETSLLGTDANAYFSQLWKKFGFSFLTANNFQVAKDVNGDGFSDLPKTRTMSIAPTFFYYFNPTTTMRFGLNGTLDNRKGGDMQVLNNEADSLHKYFEEDISNRVSSQLKFDKMFDSTKSFTFKNSVSYFDRVINLSTSEFSGNQISSYSEAAFNFRIWRQQLVAGINFTTEKFSEDSSKSHLNRGYNYYTLGFFLQDDWKINEKFAIQAGIRMDYQNQFGAFVLPRLALSYKFSRDFYVRAGSGYGYMIPSIFSTASEEEGINTVQPLEASIKAEKSINGNLDFNYKTLLGDETSLTFNQSFFITQINNPLVLETFKFDSENKPEITQGFESNARLRLDELQFFAGYIFVDAQRKYEPKQPYVPLTPKHKLNIDIIYEKENNFSIAYEYYYVSSMFRDKDINTKEYFTMGLILQKHFKHFSIIVNCEDLLDVRQTRFENIVIPPINNPTFRQIYAPLDGRVFNVALRIKI